jgi:hypothetical protein
MDQFPADWNARNLVKQYHHHQQVTTNCKDQEITRKRMAMLRKLIWDLFQPPTEELLKRHQLFDEPCPNFRGQFPFAAILRFRPTVLELYMIQDELFAAGLTLRNYQSLKELYNSEGHLNEHQFFLPLIFQPVVDSLGGLKWA